MRYESIFVSNVMDEIFVMKIGMINIISKTKINGTVYRTEILFLPLQCILFQDNLSNLLLFCIE